MERYRENLWNVLNTCEIGREYGRFSSGSEFFQFRKFYDTTGTSCSLTAKTQATLPETLQFLYGFWRQMTATSISRDVFLKRDFKLMTLMTHHQIPLVTDTFRNSDVSMCWPMWSQDNVHCDWSKFKYDWAEVASICWWNAGQSNMCNETTTMQRIELKVKIDPAISISLTHKSGLLIKTSLLKYLVLVHS